MEGASPGFLKLFGRTHGGRVLTARYNGRKRSRVAGGKVVSSADGRAVYSPHTRRRHSSSRVRVSALRQVVSRWWTLCACQRLSPRCSARPTLSVPPTRHRASRRISSAEWRRRRFGGGQKCACLGYSDTWRNQVSARRPRSCSATSSAGASPLCRSRSAFYLTRESPLPLGKKKREREKKY